MAILIEEKSISVPGEVVAEGMDYIPGPGTYRDGEKIINSRLGLISIIGRTLKTIPISGRYIPKTGDVIICRVIDVSMNGWRVETNCAYQAMLSLKDGTSEYVERGSDLTKYYRIGDIIAAKVTNVTSQMLVDITMRGPGLKKLQGGRLIKVEPYKVPRIVGKKGSMINLIKSKTNSDIVIGQNGLVWILAQPKNELIIVDAIRKIEKESHLSGLTERINKFLEEKIKDGVHKKD